MKAFCLQLPEDRLRTTEAVLAEQLAAHDEDLGFLLAAQALRAPPRATRLVESPASIARVVAGSPLKQPGPRAAERGTDIIDIFAAQITINGD